MPTVEYIGTNEKEDTVPGSKQVWAPGQEREVSDEVAAKLLFYADTWKAVGKAPEAVKPEPEKVTEPKPFEAIDYHSMTKQELVDYGYKHYGVRLDKHLSADNLRQKLVALSTDQAD